MTDKELIQWHMHQSAINHRLAESSQSTASYVVACEAEKMHRDTASRLRELIDENARLNKQYRERKDVPMENIEIVPGTFSPIELDDLEPTP